MVSVSFLLTDTVVLDAAAAFFTSPMFAALVSTSPPLATLEMTLPPLFKPLSVRDISFVPELMVMPLGPY